MSLPNASLSALTLGLLYSFVPQTTYSAEIANAAADWANASTLPANWSYLQSTAATGGTETDLAPSQSIGNAGATGFGGGFNGFNLGAILGDNANGGDFEIFVDGDTRHGGTEDTHLLMHPSGNGINPTGPRFVIARYTITAADITNNGTLGSVSGSWTNNSGNISTAVYHNNTALSVTTTFDAQFTAAAGDTISFVLGSGSGIAGDETALQASINLLVDPSTIGANDDQFMVELNSTTNLNVLANDNGVDFDISSLRITSPATGSTVVKSDGTIDYTDNSGILANDSFEYSIDNQAGTETYSATVSIQISNGLKVANDTMNFPDTPPVGGFQFPNAFPGMTFAEPTCLEHRPGDTQRLFVTERGGRIWLIPDVTAETPQRQLFLDIRSQMNTSIFGGLRGLAFHPDFANNRQFFVAYNSNSGTSRVSRFLADDGNLDAASANTETILFEQGNYRIHGINRLIFGPEDGYLYIACGDSGEGSPNNHQGAVNTQLLDGNWWSTVSRIDVDKKAGNYEPVNTSGVNLDSFGNAYYSIPADNPFVDQVAADGRGISSYHGNTLNPNQIRTEIYALGFRNPWKIGFVPGTNNLWVADVAHGQYEKFTIVPKGGNSGWGYFEGTDVGPLQLSGIEQTPPAGNLWIQPVMEYKNPASTAIAGLKSLVGGVFYQSEAIPELNGSYLFCDYTRGDFWYMKRPDPSAYQTVGRVADSSLWRMDETGMDTQVISQGSNFEAKTFNVSEIVRIGTEAGINAMTLDPSNNGSVLLSDHGDGVIRRLTFNPDDGSLPTTLTDTGAFSDVPNLTPSEGVEPYDINLTFWSDNAIKSRFFSLQDISDTFVYSRNDPWVIPEGAVFIKHFDMDLDRDNPGTDIKRLETRFIVKTEKEFYGISYRWNDEETEATLVGNDGESFDLQIKKDGSFVTQRWQIPSRGDCRTCHTTINGTALGFNTPQLNREGTLAGSSGNILELMRDAGYFSNTVDGEPITLPKHYKPGDISVNLEKRARSYLAVNCAYCHYEGTTTAPPSWAGELHLNIEDTNLIHGSGIGQGVVDDTDRLIWPGNEDKSIILSRIAVTNGYSRMPPLASSITDPEGIELITDWINNFANAKPKLVASAGPHAVTENTASGTVVGDGPTVTDEDTPDPARGTLTYTIISGNESGYFAIDSNTGEISLARTGPDFEEGAVQTLTVQVSDNFAPNPGTLTAQVVIQVGDVPNDDTQDDGILDDWATTNFGESLINPFGDSDLDGSPELLEFLAGSDPNDPTSLGLRVEPISATETGPEGYFFEWTIRKDATIGTDYGVMGSTTLSTFDELTNGADFSVESRTSLDADHERVRVRVHTGEKRYFLRLNAPAP